MENYKAITASNSHHLTNNKKKMVIRGVRLNAHAISNPEMPCDIAYSLSGRQGLLLAPSFTCLLEWTVENVYCMADKVTQEIVRNNLKVRGDLTPLPVSPPITTRSPIAKFASCQRRGVGCGFSPDRGAKRRGNNKGSNHQYQKITTSALNSCSPVASRKHVLINPAGGWAMANIWIYGTWTMIRSGYSPVASPIPCTSLLMFGQWPLLISARSTHTARNQRTLIP